MVCIDQAEFLFFIPPETRLRALEERGRGQAPAMIAWGGCNCCIITVLWYHTNIQSGGGGRQKMAVV